MPVKPVIQLKALVLPRQNFRALHVQCVQFRVAGLVLRKGYRLIRSHSRDESDCQPVVHHAVEGDMDHPSIFSSDQALDNHVAPEQVSLYVVSFFFRKG
jgi:hypothetical protein